MRYYSSVAGALTLQAGITDSDTTLVVDDVSGLPTTYPYTLIVDYGEAAEEIVDVTGAASTTLTIERGKDGTVAQSHSFGALIRHGVTARDHRESREHEAATAAHGVGEVVGTDEAQTLEGKTFQAATDVPAVVFKATSGNTEPVVEFQANDASVGVRWLESAVEYVTGSTVYARLRHGGGPALFKSILTLRVGSDIHALVGTKIAGATGKFLRLLDTDGTTELYSVDASGNVAAQDVDVAGDATVTGALDVTGAVTGSDGTFDGTAWTDVTISSGFASISTDEKPVVRRIGKVVYMQGGWSNTGLSASSTHSVGTLPSGFEPTQNQIVGLGGSAGNTLASGFVSASGVVQIRTGATVGAYYKFSLCWLID